MTEKQIKELLCCLNAQSVISILHLDLQQKRGYKQRKSKATEKQ